MEDCSVPESAASSGESTIANITFHYDCDHTQCCRCPSMRVFCGPISTYRFIWLNVFKLCTIKRKRSLGLSDGLRERLSQKVKSPINWCMQAHSASIFVSYNINQCNYKILACKYILRSISGSGYFSSIIKYNFLIMSVLI